MANFTTLKPSLNLNPERLEAFQNGQPFYIKSGDTELYEGEFHAITLLGDVKFATLTAKDAKSDVSFNYLEHCNIDGEVLSGSEGFPPLTAPNIFTSIQLESGAVVIHR